MTGEYETERTVSRVEAAEVLQRVALGVTAGGVRLGDDEDGITVAVPDAVELEVEFESEADESSLEVELEWPDDAVAGQRVAGVLDRETETEGIRETGQEGRDDRDDDGNVDEGPPAVGVASPAPSSAEFELYTDRSGEWRWRLVHDNGNVIADSGEGYARKADARNGLESVRRNAGGAGVVEQPE